MLNVRTKKIALIMSLSLSGIAFASTSNVEVGQNQSQQNNNIKYSIYAGKQMLKSNYIIKGKKSTGGTQLTDPTPSYPMPSFKGIDTFVNTHGGAFPMTWGIGNPDNWNPAKSFASLGFKDIGTELVCNDPAGCSGTLNIERNINTEAPYLPDGCPSDRTLGFVFRNKKTNVTSWFYVGDYVYTFDKFYAANGDGTFREVSPSIDSFDFGYDYDVKYGEPIGYILLNSQPSEIFSVWDGNTGYPAVIQHVTSEDSSESLSSGTFWQLAWESQVGKGSALSDTISVTHGLSKTQTSSLGYQLGVTASAGAEGFSAGISASFQQNWSWSATVNDQRTVSTKIAFPLDNDHDRGVAYYNLMLGVHTNAQWLEKFLDPANPNGFNAQIKDNFVKLQIAKSLPASVLGAENSLDAISSSGEYIFGTVSVNRD